jgi:hypothetical protein
VNVGGPVVVAVSIAAVDGYRRALTSFEHRVRAPGAGGEAAGVLGGDHDVARPTVSEPEGHTVKARSLGYADRGDEQDCRRIGGTQSWAHNRISHVWLLIVAAILLVFDLAVYFWGADSRPGFSDGRTDVKETWFPH